MAKGSRYEAIAARARARLADLHATQGQIVDVIAAFRPQNLDWYLEERITKAPNRDSLLANVQPLSYAIWFAEHGAKVRIRH